MYMGFSAMKKKMAAEGMDNPAAAAAAIGRKKYGNKAMAHASALGRKRGHGAAAAFLKGLKG